MIYFVSNEKRDFPDYIKCIGVEESLSILSSCPILQFDTETSLRDPHVGKLLCMQFGSKDREFQMVVDCTSISPVHYKKILETKLLVGQNLKFDFQWLYNYGIVPRKAYDTMIVEQLLYLGFPAGLTIYPDEYKHYGYDFPYHVKETGTGTMYQLSYALDAIAKKRCGVTISKEVRGEIRWRGLDNKVILYAAGDVTYLEDIMWSQVCDCKIKECLNGAKLECEFVPTIAYLEWCGIKLDSDKWKAKMHNDAKALQEAVRALNDFIIQLSETGYNSVPASAFRPYVHVNRQGDLFEGFNTEPQVTINWSSSQQVAVIAKLLGFNTTVQDKKTGENKDSMLEKQIKNQKGICDLFLTLYFDYQEHAKTVSTFGQAQLNMINPNTGRCHTVYRQLGAASGRMSCGSQQPNTDLAELKHLPPSECTYCNFQQLPSDELTRSCFVAEKGSLLVDSDFSA